MTKNKMETIVSTLQFEASEGQYNQVLLLAPRSPTTNLSRLKQQFHKMQAKEIIKGENSLIILPSSNTTQMYLMPPLTVIIKH